MREAERSHRGLNLFHGPDLDLCRAVFRGEFTISGFQARHLRLHLPDTLRPPALTLLKRLRVHGLIKKIGHRYKYYLTTAGRTVLATAVKLRELVVIPALTRRRPPCPRDRCPDAHNPTRKGLPPHACWRHTQGRLDHPPTP